MVKRLIFDVDNTLIEWKNEYWNTMNEVFNDLNMEYSSELVKNIITAIDTYEQKYEYYNRQSMMDYINEVSKSNFDINFLNTILKRFQKCVPENNKKVLETLEYLSKKYELVILTNWFADVQENRLKNFGILHFFNNIYAGEKFKIKPNKESFYMAAGNNKVDECIMIGDSLTNDIQGAINAGMEAIYINPKAKKEEKNEYLIINNIEELKEIL